MKSLSSSTLALGLSLFALFPSLAGAIEVLSGGYTVQTESLAFKAAWSFKFGWFENNSAWYNPEDADHWDYEIQFDVISANARWGGYGQATNTLSTDYYYDWCTQNFADVQQFDSSW